MGKTPGENLAIWRLGKRCFLTLHVSRVLAVKFLHNVWMARCNLNALIPESKDKASGTVSTEFKGGWCMVKPRCCHYRCRRCRWRQTQNVISVRWYAWRACIWNHRVNLSRMARNKAVKKPAIRVMSARRLPGNVVEVLVKRCDSDFRSINKWFIEAMKMESELLG